MSLKVKQYRYYAEDSNYNYPDSDTVNKDALIAGSLFSDEYPIIQLGIQTMPGTRFVLNNSSGNEIVVGNTGVYELELDSKVPINSLRFNEESLDLIGSSENTILIIDILKEED